MGFMPNPLQNFNKNNQFVIIAKTQYYKSQDNIQTLSKSNIKMLIRNGVALLIALLLQITQTVLGKPYWIFGWVFISFLLAGHGYLIHALILVIRYYTKDHPSVKAFDYLLKMEESEIVSSSMSHEDILKCLHLQYQVEGELMGDIKWLKISYNALLILLILDVLWNVIMIIL